MAELQEVASSVGLPKFAGKQLAEWLYVRRVSDFDAMTNISLKGREALKAHYSVGRYSPVKEAVSADGKGNICLKFNILRDGLTATAGVLWKRFIFRKMTEPRCAFPHRRAARWDASSA